MSAREPVGVVVQMRLDSTRLPGKALLPLAGASLAGAVMRRLRGIPADAYVLAADSAGAAALADTARAHGFSVFAGPKDDVLARFAMAARAFGLGRIVRATGDNPLVSVPLARLALAEADRSGADYVGLLGMPTGMGVEVVDASALARAHAEASSPYHREHVCPYLYDGGAAFSVSRPACPIEYGIPGASVTVDTRADYERVSAIFADLGDEPSDEEVLAWLRREAGGRLDD